MANDYLPVGCYGKLPVRQEYLEHNLNYPSARFLRDWIRNGRKEVMLGAEEEDSTKVSVQETVQRRFLCGAPGATELVAGVIRPSTDKEGRKHPLALFSPVPRRSFSKHYGLLPLAAASLWEALDDAWSTLSGLATESAFLEMLDSTLVPAPEPVSDVRQQYEALLEEGLEGLTDRSDGADLGFLGRSMPSVVARLRKDPANSLVRLELPVSREMDAAGFDTAFWIHLVNHQFRWKRFDPWVFLDGATATVDRLTLLGFGDLEPVDYFEVMRPRVLAGADRVLKMEEGSTNPVDRPAHSAGEGLEAESDESVATYSGFFSGRGFN